MTWALVFSTKLLITRTLSSCTAIINPTTDLCGAAMRSALI